MRPLLEKTVAGRGERLTFTLPVSVEDDVLAAWIMAKAKRKAIGRPGLLPYTISLDSVDGEDSSDLERVRRYLEQVVSQVVVRDWHQLERSDHPVLFPSCPPRSRSDIEEGLKDDVPF